MHRFTKSDFAFDVSVQDGGHDIFHAVKCHHEDIASNKGPSAFQQISKCWWVSCNHQWKQVWIINWRNAAA